MNAQQLALPKLLSTVETGFASEVTDLTSSVTIRPEDFYAYMPTHNYIYIPTREMWPAVSVNARLGKIGAIPASAWLDNNRPVEQMTWHPGSPMLIPSKLVADGGWIEKTGVNTFNLYRPAAKLEGDSRFASRWLEHVGRVYPDDVEEILFWLAHRVTTARRKSEPRAVSRRRSRHWQRHPS